MIRKTTSEPGPAHKPVLKATSERHGGGRVVGGGGRAVGGGANVGPADGGVDRQRVEHIDLWNGHTRKSAGVRHVRAWDGGRQGPAPRVCGPLAHRRRRRKSSRSPPAPPLAGVHRKVCGIRTHLDP